jgi:3-oxoacyl-[acyl-carrier-protein] synthase-1
VFILLSAPDRPYRENNLDRIVLDGLAERLGFPLPTTSQAFNEGRTGLLPACVQAASLFAAGVPHVVVVGVDSFLRQRVVDAYMRRRRVLTAANSNGFIPGEAACAVVLSPARRDLQPELQILAWGSAREPGAIDSEDPLTGDGLTNALRAALTEAGVQMADTHYWLTDQNAEHYKAKECTIAQIRLERRDRPSPEPYQIWHPIEYLGEIGAAIGPCLLGLALAAAQGSYAPGPLALMHLGEDIGARAAFVLGWRRV